MNLCENIRLLKNIILTCGTFAKLIHTSINLNKFTIIKQIFVGTVQLGCAACILRLYGIGMCAFANAYTAHTANKHTHTHVNPLASADAYAEWHVSQVQTRN